MLSPCPRASTPLFFVVAACLSAVPAAADRVELADGRVLEGSFVLLPGVATDPAAEAARGNPAGTPILACDDQLTRTMVSKRRVVKVEPSPAGLGLERIEIPQRVPENGRRVTAVGGVIETTPFDEFGRRVLALATATGRVDIVQGITQITPRWTSVEGIVTEHPVVLDMRIATSSIPRDVLRRVIDQHIDRKNPDQRLRVVRLLLQAERYDDARQELDTVLVDFPDLADLATERKGLAELAAAKLLDEILLRGRAGQDRLAMRLLEDFPASDAGGEVVEAVREARDAYRERQTRARGLIEQLRSRLAALQDEEARAGSTRIIDEMSRELSFATLDRLAAFAVSYTHLTLPTILRV